MKEFEKWDNKEYPLSSTIERGPIGRDALKQRKCAWKAALEWALKHVEKHDLNYEFVKLLEKEIENK